LGAASAAGVSAPMWLELVQRGGLPSAWGLGEADTLPLGTPICVHVSLNGGNDYLNTLAPVGDAWYNDVTYGHGAIALTANDTLPLNGLTYRLHNKLPWLADRWNNNGDVGFALGVGNTALDFSHFDSMKFWDAARTDVLGKTGWQGRYADAVRPQNALASVSVGDVQPEAVGTTAPMFVLSECSTFTYENGWLSKNVFLNGVQQMSSIDGTNKVADVARMMGTTLSVSGRISGADDPTITGDGTGYGNLAPITKQLIQTALLIKSGVPAQNYATSIGGYDSHTNQKQMQIDLFTDLNDALTHFFTIIGGSSRANDVFVMITSEFGRQATANKDNGTDHGQAGMAMFIGGGVQRGVYGMAPTLDPGGMTRPNRVGDALKPTVDFRSVHATALNRLSKGDTNVGDSVLGAHYEDLGVFTVPTPPTTTSSTSTTIKATTTTTVKPTTTTTMKPTTTTTAANKPPVAAFTPTVGSSRTVYVDGSASTDPDGSIASYHWVWGDKTTAGTGRTASHKYAVKGTYTIKLTVKDNKGKTSSVTKKVSVA
ncbi:MAG TPA: DUF1501 domain-containing protein, partial [Acidimicrobiales bacterium]|nr:DUF1501 domain-containing protein [Acidimicrobiales bacterium]